MFSAAISQLTTSRWDLTTEVARAAAHGFGALAMWRPKLSDIACTAASRMLAEAGIRVSSLQWAGGFTGADGRSFAESVADALETIESARLLGAPVVILHSGCRGGHTRSHARRLLLQALEALMPAAAQAQVTLAIQPLHAAAATDCSFLTTLAEAAEIVVECRHAVAPAAGVGLAIDLWHFADAAEFAGILPVVAPMTAVVQVADRCGPPTADHDRLPPGRGTLPLTEAVTRLVQSGFAGCFELDPVGEEVEAAGYESVLGDLRRQADAWAAAVGDLGGQTIGHAPRQWARAGAGARRSHASSQIVSRG